MTLRPRYRWLVVLLSAALLLHILTTLGAITYIPAPLVLATTLIWLVPQLPWLLVGLAIGSEVLGTAPGGVMSLVVIFPSAIYLVRRTVEVDLTFSFALLLALSSAGQILILWSADTLPVWWQGSSDSLRTFIPWYDFLLVWISTTTAVFLLSLIIHRFLYATRK